MAEPRKNMTRKRYEELTARLAYLKGTRRREVMEALSEARSRGDLAENTEYHRLRNEQKCLEDEIAQLEETIEQATTIA